MLIAALTGNIASGKSTVAEQLVAHGAVLVDADRLAREAVEPGTPALGEIVARWGAQVLAPDGALDRAALRRIVFANEADRLALNAIVHPQVEHLRRIRVEQARTAGAQVVICDIPLLFETGRADAYEVVILVDAPEALRLERLMTNRGLSYDDARRMIDAQLSSADKRARADFVIDNAGSLAALTTQVDALWLALHQRATHASIS
jgi:dephospho-CoA kinase